MCMSVLPQKLDKELEKALAALEAERNDALKNLDSQVRHRPISAVSVAINPSALMLVLCTLRQRRLMS